MKAEDKFENSNLCRNQREEINSLVTRPTLTVIIKHQAKGRRESSFFVNFERAQPANSQKESLREANFLFLLQRI